MNNRESYPNQGRRPEQDNYSNAVALFCIIIILILIVTYQLTGVYLPEFFNLKFSK